MLGLVRLLEGMAGERLETIGLCGLGLVLRVMRCVLLILLSLYC